MDISIVIVSYRVRRFLEQTLRAAQDALAGLSGEILVVDNHSADGTMEFVKPRFPGVKFIENEENVGFGRANNQAIMQARGEFTVILNPDTIITPACLLEPLQFMRSHVRCGAIGLHMVNGQGRFLPESKRGFPTPWVSFCKIFGLSKLFPRSPIFAKYHLRYLSENEAHRVDILSGAFMFCRTRLLQDLGGFDTDFFMYGEDIDLSYRISLSGHECWYLPTTMVHYKGESTYKDARYVRIFYGAMLIFYHKHFPRFRFVMLPLVKLGVALSSGFELLRRKLHKPGAQPSDAPWVILADDPAQVAAKIGVEHYATAIPATGPVQVVISDASHSYAQIVNLIATQARAGLSFHVYSSRNGLLITPKKDW